MLHAACCMLYAVAGLGGCRCTQATGRGVDVARALDDASTCGCADTIPDLRVILGIFDRQKSYSDRRMTGHFSQRRVR